MKLLITGSNGLLGQKLVKRCIKLGIPFLATSQGVNRNHDCPEINYYTLDITVEEEIQNVIDTFKPTHIIHTAAVTNVDDCELNPDLCFKVNHFAVKLLWEISKKSDIHFQLLSTDFVFDGKKGNYVETDTVNPLSHYAKSKVMAENELIDDENVNWSIVRTIIVYGKGNNLSRSNLVLWALDALPKNQPMKLVNDQFRAPTWADDLAYACIEIALRNKNGIFHICGPETDSILNIVKKIAVKLGVGTNNIEQISSATLNQSAKRPPVTGFDLTKAKKELNYSPSLLENTIEELLMK